jgi:hypothetical protein
LGDRLKGTHGSGSVVGEADRGDSGGRPSRA